eukprot:TRINITY_DN2590_c0_g1_i1.p1 TRINITY_DN2590_c0_g1~~TRINITY_DN2590_c0_g1_i1.p1  ORF type:complete len:743 (+),score=239.38 TRINITY_DN2590_c0_g1_i1:88-2316(+)
MMSAEEPPAKGGLFSKVDPQGFFDFRVKPRASDGAQGSEDDPMKPRRCGDLACLIFFALVWVAYIVVIIVTTIDGEPQRLARGTDMFGNICGKTPLNYDNITLEPGDNTLDLELWELYRYVWYPIKDPSWYAPYTNRSIDQSLNLGVCVRLEANNDCPRPGELVRVYGNRVNVSYWNVTYWSKPHLGRCLPIIKNVSQEPGDNGVPQNISDLAAQLQDAIDISHFWYEGVAEVYNSHKVVTVSAFLGMTYSLVWVFFLRTSVRFTTYGTLICFVVLTFAAGFTAWRYGDDLRGDDDGAPALSLDVSVSDWWRAFAVVMWVVTAVGLGVCGYLHLRMVQLNAIVRQGLRVQSQIMGLGLVPVWGFLFILALTALMVWVAICIETSDDLVNDRLIDGNLDIAYTIAKEYSLGVYFHILNILVWLWSIAFLSHLCYLCISFCTIFWYFSARGDLKEAPEGVGSRGLRTAVQYHLGTVAFGSLVMFPAAILRLIWWPMVAPCKWLTRRKRQCCCGCCCCHCWVSMYENGFKISSMYSYILLALLGNGFCRSARRAISIVELEQAAANATHYKIVNINRLSDIIIILGKLMVALANTVFSWVMINNNWEDLAPDTKNPTLALILIGVGSYLVAGLFIDVTAAVVDNIIMCYCYDKVVNQDTGDYFMPSAMKSALLGEDDEASAGLLGDMEGARDSFPLPGKPIAAAPAGTRSSVAEVAAALGRSDELDRTRFRDDAGDDPPAPGLTV